jgi:hypothetical protein
MSIDLLVGLAGTLLGALVTIAGVIWQLPKIRAEARLANAEASQIEWQTLRDELSRLNDLVKGQAAKIRALERAKDNRVELERENRGLKSKVARLELRVQALENILKIGPLPPDMQAALDQLDDLTSRS